MKDLDAIWRDGFRYPKAGTMLNDFGDKPVQIGLFDEGAARAGSGKLMTVIDGINQFGFGKVWFADQGSNKA